MTEPDNDSPLHESVRQKLAEYRPPFDPANWQRMQQKLAHKPWHWQTMAAKGLTGLLMVSAVNWYLISRSIEPPAVRQSVVVVPMPGAAKSVDRATANTAMAGPPEQAVRLPQLQERPVPEKPAVGETVVETEPFTASPTEYALHLLPLESLPPHPLPLVSAPTLPRIIVYSPAEADIIRQVMTNSIGSDSTTYRALSRNMDRWPNVVVVCDFTSSMYPYSTQLMTWFRKNQANTQVQGIEFFTDCDSLGRETEPGRPGQLFTTRSRAVADVLPLMLASARNTLGNQQFAENNIEPLVDAQRRFPEADHLILVADNSSRVKDLDRLSELHKPVHIILCGPTMDTAQAFQDDYLAIARQTGGSLHTLEDDLTDVGHLPPNTWIRVDKRYYRLNRHGRFVVTNARQRPRRLPTQ